MLWQEVQEVQEVHEVQGVEELQEVQLVREVQAGAPHALLQLQNVAGLQLEKSRV